MARTPRVKLQPPRRPASHVRRPALEHVLEQAERRRLTSIVAGPGFGKSTLAASIATVRGWSWYLLDGSDRSADVFAHGLLDALALDAPDAAGLISALDESIAEDRVLVVDDVQELGSSGPGVHLLEALVRQAPPELHFVLCSRDEPPFAVERLRGQGQVVDIDASMLTFSGDEVKDVVGGDLGLELGDPIRDVTGGWPAAVQLTAEMLQSTPEHERTDALAELGRSRGRLVSYLAREVLDREGDDVRRLLRLAAEFDQFNAELCDALGAAPPADLLVGLQRRGLIASRSGPGGWLTLHAVLRDFLRDHVDLPEAELADLHVTAAEWFFSEGLLREGLASLKIARRPDLIAAAFRDHWREYYERGLLQAVVDSADVVPESLIDEGLRHLIGRSHALLGRTGEALEWFAELPPGPDRAFEFAEVYTARGEQRKAFDVLVDALERYPDPPHPYCCIFIAFLAPAVGELDAGAKAAKLLTELKHDSSDLGYVADTHSALADIAQARGDVQEADRHYRAARQIAERGGNLLALCAAQVKTARFWTVQGRYREAIALNDAATAVADRIGFAQMRSECRHVRSSLFAKLGQFDEAAAELAEAVALDKESDRSTAWNSVAHGDLYVRRGDVARARFSYEEALTTADPRHVRLRSIALGGVARVVAVDDPDRAAELAAEALELSVNERPDLLVVAGWVALRRGELERAAELAATAAEDAGRRSARPVLAESLELRAFCSADADTALLEEAMGLWRELGEPVAAARVALALARRCGARLEAERRERELRQLGFRDTAGRAAGVLMAAPADGAAPLALQTLGGFRVLRHGAPVSPEEWKSKKARDLLKILAARRGKPVAREELIEALWREEDPTRTGNRLSVALSTLRSVLDPERAHAQDHFVAAADGAVRLSLESVEVDVESFLEVAEQGQRLWRSGAREQALPLLELAEAAYTGDFLEEDRYEDWAEPLRNEARAAYVEVLQALAAATQASKYFLRIIERDPYDEPAHLALVAALEDAGAHGEARRAYRTYVARMQEINAEPAPFPTHALSRV